MGWPREPLELPAELKDLILGQKCLVFVGSGASAGCYDLWPELINSLCQHCGSPVRVTEESPTEAYLDAAQDAKTRNKVAYYQFLAGKFGRPADKAGLIYDSLLALPFDGYLTVNLDPLLAIKARTSRLPCCFPVHAYPALDRKSVTNRTVHYLHGTFPEQQTTANDAIVLCKDEFDEAYDASSNLMQFLVPTIENDPIVFVGCRLQEPVMPRVFKVCKDHQLRRQRLMQATGTAGRLPRRFILIAKPAVEEDVGGTRQFSPRLSQDALDSQEQYYRSMDIDPVWYVADGPDHSALRNALETLAGLPDPRPQYGW